ncbi:ABC transporter ATP-binding protein [Lachnospiraceae bacterium MD1]|uniref:ABC transporter ATP-binding protein n=1 Tax=Variimorphobacter saccharofermentans TaxID=2755051 RepID=A0A839K3T4_9FIRM|nr:ABC transporter ATP-binding protein [Variimorphobacter saccharofermentans]MBB2183341.1 ABC transporter ATP-binding protein [Variimorphobacter saccharofermentans]
MKLYTLKALSKNYGEGDSLVRALKDIHLEIPAGKFIVVLGASGSGKSTLLNMLGCMDRPTSGQILFEDTDITAYNKREMTQFRKNTIGFVFQSYNLLPDLSAVENVEFSTEMAGLTRADAERALAMVGLTDRISHFPGQLSGGEQQRVSIARAIAKRPKVLLCDEPTGALDFETGIMVLEVLKQIHKEQGTSILFITHSQEIAKIADIVIRMRSGEILSVTNNECPLEPGEVEW